MGRTRRGAGATKGRFGRVLAVRHEVGEGRQSTHCCRSRANRGWTAVDPLSGTSRRKSSRPLPPEPKFTLRHTIARPHQKSTTILVRAEFAAGPALARSRKFFRHPLLFVLEQRRRRRRARSVEAASDGDPGRRPSVNARSTAPAPRGRGRNCLMIQIARTVITVSRTFEARVNEPKNATGKRCRSSRPPRPTLRPI
jgi:hypothetical protein